MCIPKENVPARLSARPALVAICASLRALVYRTRYSSDMAFEAECRSHVQAIWDLTQGNLNPPEFALVYETFHSMWALLRLLGLDNILHSLLQT